MPFKLTSAKVTGNPDESGWSQVHEFKPSEEKLQLRGQLFAIVSTKGGEEGLDNVKLGREILSRLHEEYFGKLTKTAFNALKEAVARVVEEFGAGGSVEIAACVYCQGAVYVAAAGGASVLINRGNSLARILDSKKGVAPASGYPKDGDIIVVGTSSFFSCFDEVDLKTALEDKDAQKAAEAVAPVIHALKEDGRAAVVFVKFSKDEKEKSIDKLPIHEEKKEPVEQVQTRKSLLVKIAEKLPERGLYVKGGETDGQKEKRRKLAVTVGIILIILLGVSIAFGASKKAQDEVRSKYEDRLEEANHSLEESLGLFNLDEERSRELFTRSQKLAQELVDEGVEDDQLKELVNTLQEKEGEILGIYNVSPELFVNLSLLSSGFNGDTMATSQDKIYVLDRQRERVVGIDIATKRSEVEAGPSSVDSPKEMSVYSGTIYLLEDSKIYEVDSGKKEVIDGDWSDSVLISSYAGNIYVLDKKESRILRYSATARGFSTARDWLAPGIEVNLQAAVDWEIDGTIWILTNKGQVLKFLNGSPRNFDISELGVRVDNIDDIYTNEESNFLYILDKRGKRIVVLDKEGVYKGEYISEQFTDAKKIAVSENEGKLLILTGEKLLFTDLKI